MGRGIFLNFQIDRHLNRLASLSCNVESLIWIEYVMNDCLDDTVKIYHIRVFDVLKIKRNCNYELSTKRLAHEEALVLRTFCFVFDRYIYCITHRVQKKISK